MVINRLRKGSYIRISEIIPIQIAEQKIPRLGDLGVDACTVCLFQRPRRCRPDGIE